MASAIWNTAVSKLLGCRYPVLLAGMGGVARHRLAAAVANAGGFGCMGMVREDPLFIHKEVLAYRTLSTQDFGINLIPAATDLGLYAEQVAVCIEQRVPVVVLFWDVEPEHVAKLRENGIRVLYQIGSTADARVASAAGVDALIVQGTEAGGHVRATQPLLQLLTEVKAVCQLPLIAAGGIASGKDILAAFSMGAAGVSCGTAFLACHESNAHPVHKEKVVQATAKDTVLTRVFWKNWHQAEPVRVLKNQLTEANDAGLAEVDIEIACQDARPVLRNSTDSPLSDATGKLELMALYAGESCERINEVVSASQRLLSMVSVAELHSARSGFPGAQHDIIEVASSPCYLDENLL